MNFENLYPYLTCGSFPKGDSWMFLCHYGEVAISQVNELLCSLLPLCDGERTGKEIIKILAEGGLEQEVVAETLQQLFEHRILGDKHCVFDCWRRYGENPMTFYQDISEEEVAALIRAPLPSDDVISFHEHPFSESQFTLLLEKRRSTRDFSPADITSEQLSGLFWAAYGRQRQRGKHWKYGEERTLTVPSGGALFPLVIYLMLSQSVESMQTGIYRWDPDAFRFMFLKNQPQLDDIGNIINGIDSFENVVGVMAVFADFGRVSLKYSNKAYPLILLEAGHVMQNAYLFCAERGIGFVEVMGFYQEPLKALIGNSVLEPVVVGVFGGT